MIVRILEDGQYKVDKPTAKKLNDLDAKLGKGTRQERRSRVRQGARRRS